MLKKQGLQQREFGPLRTPNELLTRSAQLHFQLALAVFSTRCSFSANHWTRVVQVMKSTTRIQDRADLTRLFGNWSTVSQNCVLCNGGASGVVFANIVELTLVLKSMLEYPTFGLPQERGDQFSLRLLTR